MIIIINLVLSILACIQLGRAFYRSRLLQATIEARKNEFIQHGLIYLLAEDKMAVYRMSRLIIGMLITANFLLGTWSISRILENFTWDAIYATAWITITAIIFHLLMAIIAHCIYMVYSQRNISFINKIKI